MGKPHDGPYRVVRGEKSNEMSKIMGPGDDFLIGYVIRDSNALAREFDDATADLLAAAPELLSALEECITDENANCIVTNDVAYMIRRFRAINAIAREAIKKATGC